jgi:hypothetical protein
MLISIMVLELLYVMLVMKDPSQEEAPAAAEPAGDQRPSLGRPPRHRP